jgi:hypothetical protein
MDELIGIVPAGLRPVMRESAAREALAALSCAGYSEEEEVRS